VVEVIKSVLVVCRCIEIANHLGNVLATLSDRKTATGASGTPATHFNAIIQTANDYYPFGMIMPGRNYNNGTTKDYRYGFNGKENDNEVKGEGNQQDYGMRIYDPRLGKFLSVDPLKDEFPWNSPYAFAENDVINNIDLDGAEKLSKDELLEFQKWNDTRLKQIGRNLHLQLIALRGASDAVFNASFLGLPDLFSGTNLGDYTDVAEQEAYLRGRIGGDIGYQLFALSEIGSGGGIAGGSGGTLAIAGGAVALHGVAGGATALFDLGWSVRKLLDVKVPVTLQDLILNSKPISNKVVKIGVSGGDLVATKLKATAPVNPGGTGTDGTPSTPTNTPKTKSTSKPAAKPAPAPTPAKPVAQPTTPTTKNGGKLTEPKLPPKTVAQKGDIKAVHYTKSGDHGPAHLHIKGGGAEVKIGQNGKPLKGQPALSAAQQAFVNSNKGIIRKAITQIQKYHKYSNQ
jgi:RHS repeat-associated protein